MARRVMSTRQHVILLKIINNRANRFQIYDKKIIEKRKKFDF